MLNTNKIKTVVISGASKGIGRAFAVRFAKEKANLILLNRKVDDVLVEELKSFGATSVKITPCDFIKKADIDLAIKNLESIEIDILFNNAGLLTGGLLEKQPIDDIYNMLQVNVTGLIHLTHGLLPQMIKRKSGVIINHSSVSAIMHFPCATTYAASKAAVWAFNNCLELELKGTGVSTLLLHTPGIKTQMFDQIDVLYGENLKTPQDTISPEEYADKIYDAVLSGKRVLLPTGSTGVAFRVAKHTKPLFDLVANNIFKRS